MKPVKPITYTLTTCSDCPLRALTQTLIALIKTTHSSLTTHMMTEVPSMTKQQI